EEFRARENATRMFNQFRQGQKHDDTCDWFTIESADRQEIRELSGRWSKGVDGAKGEVETSSTLKLKAKGRDLLKAKKQALVSEYKSEYWPDSRLIVVTNGSFLLNLPLVNHEHRKLAARLVAAVEPGQVVFLESGLGGPAIDPKSEGGSLWTLFGA